MKQHQNKTTTPPLPLYGRGITPFRNIATSTPKEKPEGDGVMMLHQFGTMGFWKTITKKAERDGHHKKRNIL